MADSDNRLDTVEDELKVLKGEVRRTLVDLRALLMRADSPMNEASIGRRDALPDRDPGDEPKPAKTEMSQVIQQETAPAAAAPAQAPAQPPAPAQPATAGPGQPPSGGPGQPPGGLFPPGAGPQQGSINPPVSAPPMAASSGDQDRALAEQQRRMADQERMLAEQNSQMAELSRKVQEGAQAAQQPPGTDPAQQRKLEEQQRQIADQSRQMVEMSRRMDDESHNARDSRDSDGQQERRLGEQERSITEQNRRIATMDRKLEEQGRSADDGRDGKEEDRERRDADQSRQIADLRRMVEEEGRSSRDAMAEAENSSQPRHQRGPERSEDRTGSDGPEQFFEDEIDKPHGQYQGDSFLDDAFDEHQEQIERPTRPAGRHGESASRRRDQRAGGGRGVDGAGDKERRPSRPKPDGSRQPRPAKTGSNKMVLNRPADAVHDDVEEPYRTGSGSHVYDEYQQLFETVGGAEGLEDDSVNSAPLDVNLLASLVRWTTLAKVRVGEARLKNILDLYLGSGRSSPQLRELLISVSKMVDTVSDETPQAAQECMDLLSHLHGILTGGLQIAQVPQISLSE